MTDALITSQEYCQQVSRTRARNFYYGMKLVPQPKRAAQFALYAWMRLADDLADEAGSAEQKTAAIEQFAQTTRDVLVGKIAPADATPQPDLWPAFYEMATRYKMPVAYFDDMLAGQLIDQDKHQYKTFDELYDYCYKVASVVGLSCIEIWGYEGGEQTRQLAEWRGIAFQLTNILRDVREDAENGRVYLPADDFGVFELNPSMFALAKPQEVRPGLQRVVDRALDYYKRSQSLDKLVHRDGLPCLWAMTRIYRGLLNKIVADPLCVLRPQRVRLPSYRKAWIALRAMAKGKVRL